MDAVTLAAAVAIAKKTTLPAVTNADAGATLVVDSQGQWAKGEAVTATVSVSGTTLSITQV